MKKISSIFLLILISSGWLIAQSGDDSEWKIFSGYQGDFTVNAPLSFSLSSYDEKEVGSPKDYFAKSDGISFAAWTARNTESSRLGAFETFIQSNNAVGTAKRIDSFKSITFSFSDLDGHYHQMAFVETDSRFFIFHLFSANENKEKFAKFFSSIKINPVLTQKNPTSISLPVTSQSVKKEVQPKKQVSQTSKNVKPPDTASKVSGQGTGVGRGNGVGSGSGSGRGVGSGSGSGVGSGSGTGSDEKAPAAAPPSSTEPLKILSKTRPGYTDIARIYNIQGTVTLRVTFLANGTIGSVTPVSGLPLGLTNSAINAAKQMRFEPAKKDNVPYTVTRQVQFSYTLY